MRLGRRLDRLENDLRHSAVSWLGFAQSGLKVEKVDDRYRTQKVPKIWRFDVNNTPTIKNVYSLDYSGLRVNSGLINWYNRLLGKTVDELDEIDVSKMIRQGILVDLAIDSALNILKNNPYAGEMYDGDILNSLSTLVKNQRINVNQLKKLKHIVCMFSWQVSEFEWGELSKRELFIKNIEYILTIQE